MFPCGACNKTSKPGDKATRVVIETRPAVYPFIQDAHHFRKDGKRMVKHDPGGRGTEVSKEMNICPSCAGIEPKDEIVLPQMTMKDLAQVIELVVSTPAPKDPSRSKPIFDRRKLKSGTSIAT